VRHDLDSFGRGKRRNRESFLPRFVVCTLIVSARRSASLVEVWKMTEASGHHEKRVRVVANKRQIVALSIEEKRQILNETSEFLH
jgi:hypothetical protein